MTEVADFVKKAKERLPKLEALAQNYRAIMEASDATVRIYNLNKQPNAPYKKDAVFQKLRAVRDRIFRDMVEDSECRSFHTNHFSREFVTNMISRLVSRDLVESQYRVLLTMPEGVLAYVVQKNAQCVVDDVNSSRTSGTMPYKEFEQKVYDAIRVELFKG